MRRDATDAGVSIDEMSDAAKYIRKLYCDAVRRFHWARGVVVDYGSKPIPEYDGGVTAMGRNRINVWPGITRFVIQYGLNPVAVMNAAFFIATKSKSAHPPKPDFIASQEGLALYERQRERLEDQKRVELQSAKSRFDSWVVMYMSRDNCTQAAASARALSAPATELPALFRYGMARKLGLNDVADKCKVAGIRDYVWNQELLGSWVADGILPPDIDKLADDYRQAMLA